MKRHAVQDLPFPERKVRVLYVPQLFSDSIMYDSCLLKPSIYQNRWLYLTMDHLYLAPAAFLRNTLNLRGTTSLILLPLLCCCVFVFGLVW